MVVAAMPSGWMPDKVEDHLLCVEAEHHWRAQGKNYAMALGFRRTGDDTKDEADLLRLRQAFWDKIQQSFE